MPTLQSNTAHLDAVIVQPLQCPTFCQADCSATRVPNSALCRFKTTVDPVRTPSTPTPVSSHPMCPSSTVRHIEFVANTLPTKMSSDPTLQLCTPKFSSLWVYDYLLPTTVATLVDTSWLSFIECRQFLPVHTIFEAMDIPPLPGESTFASVRVSTITVSVLHTLSPSASAPDSVPKSPVSNDTSTPIPSTTFDQACSSSTFRHVELYVANTMPAIDLG